jgi:hypothetical protein
LILQEFEKTQSSLLPPKRSVVAEAHEDDIPKKKLKKESGMKPLLSSPCGHYVDYMTEEKSDINNAKVFNVDLKEVQSKLEKEKEIAAEQIQKEEVVCFVPNHRVETHLFG